MTILKTDKLDKKFKPRFLDSENLEIITKSHIVGEPGIRKKSFFQPQKSVEESERTDIMYAKGETMFSLLKNGLKGENKVIILDRDPQDKPDLLEIRTAEKSRAMRSHDDPLFLFEAFKKNSSNSCSNVMNGPEDFVKHVLKKDGKEVSATDDESSKNKRKP
jgi:hypothetical protein